MALPTEMIQSIVQHSIEPKFLPSFPLAGSRQPVLRWDLFIASQKPISIETYEKTSSVSTFYSQDLDLKTLLNLRLVSRVWNAVVESILTEHLWWRADLDKDLQKALRSTDTDQDLSHVRKLMIPKIWDSLTYKRWVKMESQLEEDGPVSQEYGDELFSIKNRTPMRYHYDKTAEHRSLRTIFDRLTRVEVLSLSFPEASTHRFRGPDAAFCHDLQAVEEILETVQYGLRSAAFSHLVDLRLELPCTRNVKDFADAMTQEAKDRIKHLFIAIKDSTGLHGSNSHIFSSRMKKDDYDGLTTHYSYFPRSPMQEKYPNRKYQTDLWEFVASCTNLESLGIEATHYLDLNLLSRKKVPRGLRVLHLERLYVSVPALLNLLQPSSADGPSPVQRINFHDLKMLKDGGNWSQIFSYIHDHCPELECARLYQLSYMSRHPRYEPNCRPHENSTAVWSKNKRDERGVKKLLKHIVPKCQHSIDWHQPRGLCGIFPELDDEDAVEEDESEYGDMDVVEHEIQDAIMQEL